MVDTQRKKLKNFVGGEYVDASDGRYSDLINPATGEVFASAPVSSQADVNRAFEVASRAFESWRDTTPSERQLALFRIADAIEERADELVRAESENTGKPFGLTMEEEIPAGVDQIRFAGAAAAWRASQPGSTWKGTPPSSGASRWGYAQVTPWNYPMMMAIWKFAPAIAAGNTVVIKPSDTTPISTVMLAEIAAEFCPRASSTWSAGTGHGPDAGPAPDAADGLDHRLRPGRHGGSEGGRRRPQAGPPRARRQGSRHHLRRRRPG